MKKLFLTSSGAKMLDKIVLELPKSPQELALAFVPTAADPYDDKPWMHEDRKKLEQLGFIIKDLDINGKSEEEIRENLKNIDIVFVAGGNTFYLLEKSLKSGFDKVVKELIGEGTIYIGSSAGSIIVGPDIEPVKIFDDPDKAQLESTKAFGLVDFVVMPHYKKEKYSPYQESILKEYRDKYAFVPITDEQMIVVTGDEYQIVTAESSNGK